MRNPDGLWKGKGNEKLVVMSIETYEKSIAKLELYKKLAEAEAEIKNGVDLLDAEEVFKKFKEKEESNRL